MKKLLTIAAITMSAGCYTEQDLAGAYDEGKEVGYHEGYALGHDRGENKALDTLSKIMDSLQDTETVKVSIYVLDTNTYFLSAKTIPNY